MRPEMILGTLLPQAQNPQQLLQMAAMVSPPPTDGAPLAPPTAMNQGALGAALAPKVQKPNPSMQIPAVPGLTIPNPGNPSIGAALAG